MASCEVKPRSQSHRTSHIKRSDAHHVRHGVVRQQEARNELGQQIDGDLLSRHGIDETRGNEVYCWQKEGDEERVDWESDLIDLVNGKYRQTSSDTYQ